MDSEIDILRASDGLQHILGKLAALAGGLATMAFVIGVATFATGLWIFDGGDRLPWIIIGGILCAAPVIAAVFARFLVTGAAKQAPALIANVREFYNSAHGAARVLVDHDSRVSIGTYGRTFSGLRTELDDRRKELPALWAGIRAVTRVPGLAVITVVGMLGVGVLGTVLLIGGLID